MPQIHHAAAHCCRCPTAARRWLGKRSRQGLHPLSQQRAACAARPPPARSLWTLVPPRTACQAAPQSTSPAGAAPGALCLAVSPAVRSAHWPYAATLVQQVGSGRLAAADRYRPDRPQPPAYTHTHFCGPARPAPPGPTPCRLCHRPAPLFPGHRGGRRHLQHLCRLKRQGYACRLWQPRRRHLPPPLLLIWPRPPPHPCGCRCCHRSEPGAAASCCQEPAAAWAAAPAG